MLRGTALTMANNRDWARWEREIDYLAMLSVNMPLAFNGQEWVFMQVSCVAWRRSSV